LPNLVRLSVPHYLRLQVEDAETASLGVGYDRPVGKAIYAIDAFPDDAQLWRIDWIGGVAYNASVPSEPLIDVFLARLPKGETNPLSANSRSKTMISRDFFSVANNLGDSVAFNLESDSRTQELQSELLAAAIPL
jgi:hypothetical protein